MTIDRKTFLKLTLGSGLGFSLNPVSISLTGRNQISNNEGNEYHVSVSGNDQNDGSSSAPFKSITKASEIAETGDIITVHEGVYRERITPPRGGTSDDQRIIYRAANEERVEIKGSEVIDTWSRFKGSTWKVVIPNTFFGEYNPYSDIISGDWFHDLDREHHTGQVYLNGTSLDEMDKLERVLNPKPEKELEISSRTRYTWYCETDEDNTYIYANFHGANPNREMVEINVRESCFYPAGPGINYITIDGFHMSQAATQWAAPTAEQIGLIGTFWSKGWIIQNNVISESRCTGITLGKDRETGHNVWSKNPCKGGAAHYNEVIERAITGGWSKEKIGSHLVRGNEIFNCEQAGIVGSMGAIFSEISDNYIHDIWAKRYFSGHEMAGIKLHGPIDCLIKSNRICNTGRGMWMDWMTQGTRISGNLCYNNSTDDLFIEVNHGPYLIDNNVLLSRQSLRDWSQGGAFAHNLIAGKIFFNPQDRKTPYFAPHSTLDKKLQDIDGGDNRYYNNIFTSDNPQDSEWQFESKNKKDGYGTQLYNRGLAFQCMWMGTFITKKPNLITKNKIMLWSQTLIQT